MLYDALLMILNYNDSVVATICVYSSAQSTQHPANTHTYIGHSAHTHTVIAIAVDGVFTAHKTINVIWIAQIVFN